MSNEQYEVGHYRVQSLLTKIEDQEIAIPEIQRPFVWSTAKVRDFIDSLYRGYPVGYLIAWRSQDARLKDGSASIGRHILIDGQQRVAALMSALLGHSVVDKNYHKRRIYIAFHPIEERFEVASSAIRNDSSWISDISEVFSQDAWIRELVDRYCERNRIDNPGMIDRRLRQLESIKNNTLGLIMLNNDLDVKTVAEIFIRVNSTGVTLNAADFAMSRMASNEDYGGHQLRKCIDYFCHLAKRPEAYSDLIQDEEFADTEYFRAMSWLKSDNDDIYDPSYSDMLRVAFTSEFKRGKLEDLVALLSGRDFETRDYKESIAKKSYEQLGESAKRYMNKENFQGFIGILRSAGFVQRSMVRSMNAVNFAYILYLMLRNQKERHSEIEALTRKWYVMSVLTKRYSGSTETTFDQDIRKIGAQEGIVSQRAQAYLEQIERANLSDNFWDVSLPSNLNVSVQTSPYFKVFLASLVKANDNGFLSRDHIVRDLLQGNSEIHHVFPKSYLAKRGYTKGVYNQLANYVVVQSEINRTISDTPPTEYFKAVREQCGAHTSIAIDSNPRKTYGSIADADDLLANYKQHCIPYEILEEPNGSLKETYDAFCEARRKRMAVKMRDYYRGLSSVVAP